MLGITDKQYQMIEDGWACDVIKEVRRPSMELCYLAVKVDGLSLEFIENQTPDLCIIAVSSDSHALAYVEDQTKDICIRAIEGNYVALKYVKDQTFDICLAAAEISKDALDFIRDTEMLESIEKELERLKNLYGLHDEEGI